MANVTFLSTIPVKRCLCESALMRLLLHRYWRRTLGLQVHYADCGGYRFCYSHRGKPGMRPSILMLHGFSAHKDTWLTLVKVRVTLIVCCYELGALMQQVFAGLIFSVQFLMRVFISLQTRIYSFWASLCTFCCSSICQSICTSCVWTCLATREQHAPTQRIIPFRGRSGGSTRYTEEIATEGNTVHECICQVPNSFHWISFFLSLILLSSWKPFAWAGNLSIWWEPPWGGT